MFICDQFFSIYSLAWCIKSSICSHRLINLHLCVKRRTNARVLCTKKLFVRKRTRTIWNLILFVSLPEKLIKNEKSILGISHRHYMSSICTRRFLNNFIYLCLQEIRLNFYKSTNSISSSPLWSIWVYVGK